MITPFSTYLQFYFSTGALLYDSNGAVLAAYWRSTGGVLAQYQQSTGWQYCHSIGGTSVGRYNVTAPVVSAG